MSLILVTGATGRIGSHVSEALLSRNDEVRAIVRKGSKGAIPSGAEKYEHDLASPQPLPNAAFDGVSKVIHLAGLVGDFSASELVKQNALATKNLLSSCPLSLQKFVHASSISVYGEYREQLVDETFHPHPDSHYGRSKLLAEEFCSEYCKDFPIVMLRFGMVYGPGFEDRYEKVLEYIEVQKNIDGQEFHTKLHEIRKEIEIEPKDFFSALYLSFLGKESGPKAGWFLSVLDRNFLTKRLKEVTL